MPDIIPLDLPASYWRGRGQQAQRGGNSREAVRLYRTALRKHADSALRRDLAQAYADLMCLSASDRLYLENLAQDAGDTDSLYGLARNRSLAGDERQMADLLDLYLRLAPCGEKADRARDILWQLPRDTARPQRLRRAEALCRQAEDARMQPARSLRLARQSWQRGKTPEAARLLCQLYLGLRQNKKALRYALAACRLAPEDLNARQLLAVAMYENHYPQGCRAALRQAAALCRDLDQLPLFTGCAMSLDAADLAVELLDTWLKKYPASADLMLLQAMALRCVPEGAERADALFAAAEELDAENPMALFARRGAEMQSPQEQAIEALSQLRRLSAVAKHLKPEYLHRELVRTMRLPLPGMLEAAVQLFLRNEDALGLRMVLLEADLPPMMYGLILSTLETLGEPLPCLARVDGRLTLLPQRPRPPYDADLHALIRTLVRDLPQGVFLDQVVREVPPLWRRLPFSARAHCAQSRDRVWPTAFSAYLALRSGSPKNALEILNKSACPKRTKRAYMQLIRRSNGPYEVHRL